MGIGVPEVAADLVSRRRDLESGAVSLADLIATAGVRVDLSDLWPVARWVTPMPSVKRYDTAFFVARAPAGAEPVVDGREAVHAEWCRPADALARSRGFRAREPGRLPRRRRSVPRSAWPRLGLPRKL